MSPLSPSTITLFGTGMKDPACAVAKAAVSSNPANPIAIAVFGMASVLPGLGLAHNTTVQVARKRFQRPDVALHHSRGAVALARTPVFPRRPVWARLPASRTFLLGFARPLFDLSKTGRSRPQANTTTCLTPIPSRSRSKPSLISSSFRRWVKSWSTPKRPARKRAIMRSTSRWGTAEPT
jgi:hypothetical protein